MRWAFLSPDRGVEFGGKPFPPANRIAQNGLIWLYFGTQKNVDLSTFFVAFIVFVARLRSGGGAVFFSALSLPETRKPEGGQRGVNARQVSVRGSFTGRVCIVSRGMGRAPGVASHKAGTLNVSFGVLQSYTVAMAKTLIGYARCSTDKQDLAAQQAALLDLAAELGLLQDIPAACKTAVLKSGATSNRCCEPRSWIAKQFLPAARSGEDANPAGLSVHEPGRNH